MSNEMKEWLADMKVEEEAAKQRGMCIYCDYRSSRNMIYKDFISGDYYMDINSGVLDNVGEPIYAREFINYCPYCGRELKDE